MHCDRKVRYLTFFIIILGPLFYGALALYLGQDSNWDFRNYHWYNGFAFVTKRLDIDILAAQMPSFYNPLMDVPFYLLGNVLSAKLASFILGFIQGLNFPLLFIISFNVLIIPNKQRKILICAFLAGLGILGGGGIAQIGTTFYDNITSLGLFLSLLLVIRFWKKLYESSWLTAFIYTLIIGLPTGLMMGLKLPSVIFCVGLCGAFLFCTGNLRRRLFLSFTCGLGILLGLMITYGPWSYHLWLTYQNPLFPYFNDFFASPYAPATNFRDVKFLPHGFFEHFFFPFIFAHDPLRVGEISWQDFRIPILYALLPLALTLRLLFGRNKNSQDLFFHSYFARFLLWVGVISYFTWLFLFGIYRYLLPLEMLGPLLLILTVNMLPLRASRRVKFSGILFLVVILSIQAGNWGRHKPWLDKMIKVDVPALENSATTMILMASLEPYSHVISAFPEKIPFVRIQSNLTMPENNTAFSALIKNRIKAHQGNLKVLIPDWALNWTQEKLNPFNVMLTPSSCLPLHDHLYDSRLVLCDARQTKEKP